MNKTLLGKVRGKTIELDEELGVEEGQRVEITVKTLPTSRRWGDGLRRCAGVLAHEWSAEDDRILEEIHQDRQRDTRKEIVE